MELSRTKLVRRLRVQLQASPKQAKVLAALAAVFLIALVRMIFSLGPGATEAAPPPVTATVAPTPAPQPSSAVEPAPAVREPLPELPATAERDLFMADWLRVRKPKPVKLEPQPTKREPDEDSAPEFVLELTLTSATDTAQHYAVINGRRFRVGDVIEGYVLESIAPGVVQLRDREGSPLLVRMN